MQLLKSLKNKLSSEPKPGFRRHSPEALYILKQGQLESYRSSQTNSALAFSFLPEQLTYRSWCWISQFSEQLLPAQTVTYGLFRPLNWEVVLKPEITGVFTPDGSGIKSAHICTQLRARAAARLATLSSNRATRNCGDKSLCRASAPAN